MPNGIDFIPNDETRIGRYAVAIRVSDGVLVYDAGDGQRTLSTEGGYVPNPLPDDTPFYVGTDLAGGIIKVGSGRSFYVGDIALSADALAYTRVVHDLGFTTVAAYAQDDGDLFDSGLNLSVTDGASAYFQLQAYDEANSKYANIGGGSNGVIDAYMVGDAPVFNIHDNLHVINPFSTPAAPTAVLSATAGVVTAGDHDVRLRYNTAAGSVLSDATTVTADGSHKIDATVPALPVGVLSIDVVMTKADESSPIYEVALDQAPGVYAINTADVGLTVVVPTANTAGGNLTVGGEIRPSAHEAIRAALTVPGAALASLENELLVWYTPDDNPERSYIAMQSVGGGYISAATDADHSRVEIGHGNTYFDVSDTHYTLYDANSDEAIDVTAGAMKISTDNIGLYSATPVPQGAHLSGGGITAEAIYAQLEAMGIFAAS